MLSNAVGNAVTNAVVTHPVTLPPTRPDPTRPVLTYVRASVTSACGRLWNSPNPKSSLTYRARLATFGLGSFA